MLKNSVSLMVPFDQLHGAQTESEWVARYLEGHRHEVLVADTNFAPTIALPRLPNEQIKQADEQLAQVVKDDEVVARLCTVPGVGPVTATSFAAALDNVTRFADAKRVRAYLGLVPSEHSSVERRQRGGISKAGPDHARAMLVEAAWQILRGRNQATAGLYLWAARIAKRRGKKIAAVALAALARKPAGILYAILSEKKLATAMTPVSFILFPHPSLRSAGEYASPSANY